MHFHILTLFPELFDSVLSTTMLKKGQERGALQFSLHNIRDFAVDKHRVTDDTPYGGGEGMVMKPEPIVAALEALGTDSTRPRRILLSPRAKVLNQERCAELAALPSLALVCGRYEGVDERVVPFVDEELSIGDFVLSGGEIAALVLIDAVSRLVPGVLGSDQSATIETFNDGLLEYPQYTRPAEFRGQRVPEILLSGDHQAVARWRRQESLRRTLEHRPDLLGRAALTDEGRAILASLRKRRDG
ncbi:MAG TPA: tRNA (guanosine(37)-N1)-methyltransferase TrmD [Candidatus Acidoferrales bacterium]|nr:tRNA (guanosine(37)-N1)-methyltransferase TrmD [Candidatus Acidoferrales bacterium]